MSLFRPDIFRICPCSVFSQTLPPLEEESNTVKTRTKKKNDRTPPSLCANSTLFTVYPPHPDGPHGSAQSGLYLSPCDVFACRTTISYLSLPYIAGRTHTPFLSRQPELLTWCGRCRTSSRHLVFDIFFVAAAPNRKIFSLTLPGPSDDGQFLR